MLERRLTHWSIGVRSETSLLNEGSFSCAKAPITVGPGDPFNKDQRTLGGDKHGFESFNLTSLHSSSFLLIAPLFFPLENGEGERESSDELVLSPCLIPNYFRLLSPLDA